MIKIFLVVFLFLAFPQISQAGFLDSLPCIDEGNCGLNEVVAGLVFLIRLMLGGMGAVALVYLVIGGLQWITSAGSPDKVKKGKEIMMNTIFALALAFSSYIILDLFVNKILNVKSGFSGVRTGTVSGCRDPLSENTSCGDNQVCFTVPPAAGGGTTPQRQCITECRRKAITTGVDWQCYRVPDPTVTSTYPQYFEGGLCPGDIYNLCTNIEARDFWLEILNNL